MLSISTYVQKFKMKKEESSKRDQSWIVILIKAFPPKFFFLKKTPTAGIWNKDVLYRELF